MTVRSSEEFSIALHENINKFEITFTEENVSHEGGSSQRQTAEKTTETPCPITENTGSTGNLPKDQPQQKVRTFPVLMGIWMKNMKNLKMIVVKTMNHQKRKVVFMK